MSGAHVFVPSYAFMVSTKGDSGTFTFVQRNTYVVASLL